MVKVKSKYNYIVKRLRSVRFINKQGFNDYIKILLWLLIDTPRVLNRYKAYRILWNKMNKLLKDLVLLTEYGMFLIPDAYSIWVLLHYENFLVNAFTKIFSKNKDLVFVDGGAHIGKYTVLAGRLLRNGIILSFEPHPTNFTYLLINVFMNNLDDNIKLYPAALWDRKEYIIIMESDISSEHACFPIFNKKPANITWTLHVPAIPLDDIVKHLSLKDIDLIKIDVEGAELRVLRGAINTIVRCRPHIVIECWFNNFNEVVRFLRYHGYNIVKLHVEQTHAYLYAYPLGEKPFEELIITGEDQ